MFNIEIEKKVYHYKTKRALEEVISSYNNGNYRSSIVILYTTVIYDLFLKLKELRDVYNDKAATSMLKESNTEDFKKYTSDWEWELVKNIFDRTDLIDKSVFAEIEYLKKIRNLSAHPVFNEDFELYEPNKYTVISLIRSMTENLFYKPPIFISDIVEVLTEDLDGKWQIYEGNFEKLEAYLNIQYFSKMSLTMKEKVLKSFWKFCFHETEHKEWINNLAINRNVINVLLSEGIEVFSEFIMQESIFDIFDYRPQSLSFQNLVIFLSDQPKFYGLLTEHSKHLIENSIDKIDNIKPLTWFLYESIEEHTQNLNKSIEEPSKIDLKVMKRMRQKYEDFGLLNLYHDYIIEIYGNSKNFNIADIIFNNLIESELDFMNLESINELLKHSNTNDQVYSRGLFNISIKKVVSAGMKLGLKYAELEKYDNFNKKVRDLFDGEMSEDRTEQFIEEFMDLPF